MQIIELEEKDLLEALKLIKSVFDEFIGYKFSKKGRKEFYHFISFENIITKYKEKKLIFFGYFLDNKLVGVIALRDESHISLLFVDKNYQGRGIAKALFKEIVSICESDYSITKISVNSSPYAINFYRKIGFLAIEKEKVKNGIRFTPMEYVII